ncbi:hypothetical protein MSAN_02380300 [Mycena sanguinolenta]|uniref:Uncharacterized protein n=1 Tax=Mycena sanguinolenta TaxID=230812 RepID=A0A8H6X4X0_9AGAR|nr:hypothetical protein MSAN_02380300 [Mycena sanguinolenta]
MSVKIPTTYSPSSRIADGAHDNATELPNPFTPLAFFPPTLASQFEVSGYFYAATLGAYIWDIGLNLGNDHALLFKHMIRFPTIAYFLSRAFTLAFILTCFVAQVGHSFMARLRAFFGGTGLSTLSQALLQSGQHFYLIAVVTHIALLVLLKLHQLSPVYRVMLTVPGFALINAMACQVFRRIKFGLISSDGTSKILSLASLWIFMPQQILDLSPFTIVPPRPNLEPIPQPFRCMPSRKARSNRLKTGRGQARKFTNP